MINKNYINTNTLVIGSTGSGKTTQYVIPEILKTINQEQSFFVTDSKCEILNFIYEDLKERDYKLIIFNLRGENSHTWNPLHEPYQYFIKRQIDKSVSLLCSLSQEIFPISETNKDDFWILSARNYFVGLALLLFFDANDIQEINFKSMYYLCVKGNERFGMHTYLKEYTKIRNNDEFDLVSSYLSVTLNAPADTRGGILSIYLQKMNSFLKSNIISNNINDVDFVLKQLNEEKLAIILQYSDEVQEMQLSTKVLIKQIFKKLIYERKSKNIQNHSIFNFYFDDFISLGYISGIEDLYLSSVNKNISIKFIVSDLYLLKNLYGEYIVESLKINCGKIIYIDQYLKKEMIDFDNKLIDIHDILSQDIEKKYHMFQYNFIPKQQDNNSIKYFRFDEKVQINQKNEIYDKIPTPEILFNKPEEIQKMINDIDIKIAEIEEEERKAKEQLDIEKKKSRHWLYRLFYRLFT